MYYLNLKGLIGPTKALYEACYGLGIAIEGDGYEN